MAGFVAYPIVADSAAVEADHTVSFASRRIGTDAENKWDVVEERRMQTNCQPTSHPAVD